MLDSPTGRKILERVMKNLDLFKEEFNQAYRAYDALLEEESVKGAAYRDFDLCDREYTECRMRLSERLHSINQQKREEYEANKHESKLTKSSHSGKTKISGSSGSSRSSVMSKRVEVTARAAKLKVEMKYLAHETNLRRIQLHTDTEEEAIKMVMKEETTNKGAFGEEPAEGSSNSEGQEKINEVRPDLGNIVVNAAPSKFNPDASPFEPRSSNPTVLQQTPPPEEDMSVCDATLKEIVSLQAKQTELSTLIVNQQRASMLPSQEPPVFNGSYFDYLAFVGAFDTMIANKVDSGKDKLYFLSKYTSGKLVTSLKSSWRGIQIKDMRKLGSCWPIGLVIQPA